MWRNTMNIDDVIKEFRKRADIVVRNSAEAAESRAYADCADYLEAHRADLGGNPPLRFERISDGLYSLMTLDRRIAGFTASKGRCKQFAASLGLTATFEEAPDAE
jgi:hypothetical protein